MPTLLKKHLSGTTSGSGVGIDAVASPGTTIHTVATDTGIIDEVFLYAVNMATADRILTVEIAATGVTSRVQFTVPDVDGLYTILPGTLLSGSGTLLKAFATATGVINVFGHVNRYAS